LCRQRVLAYAAEGQIRRSGTGGTIVRTDRVAAIGLGAVSVSLVDCFDFEGVDCCDAGL
jgi:hypothetical protein